MEFELDYGHALTLGSFQLLTPKLTPLVVAISRYPFQKLMPVWYNASTISEDLTENLTATKGGKAVK